MFAGVFTPINIDLCLQGNQTAVLAVSMRRPGTTDINVTIDLSLVAPDCVGSGGCAVQNVWDRAKVMPSTSGAVYIVEDLSPHDSVFLIFSGHNGDDN